MAKAIKTPAVLRELFQDIGNEPAWRGTASRVCQYRDNDPWTSSQKEIFRSLDMPDNLFVNLLAAANDSVTGYEAKSRTDWSVLSDDVDSNDLAEALNHELNTSMRLAEANEACSAAYGAMVGPGVGWVYVGPSNNILSPSSLLIEDVHRDEVFWDMRSRSSLLRRDCRYILRRRFFDEDTAMALLPDHKELIKITYSNDWTDFDIAETDATYTDWMDALSSWKMPVEATMQSLSGRKRVPIYETYYKVTEKRDVIITPDGMAQLFDDSSQQHTELLWMGRAEVLHRPVPVVREAWFIGPNCIWDGPSRAPHNDFPLVPFFAFRTDADNVPQGLLVRGIGPQDEYNRAVVEIQKILTSIRIEMDENAAPGMTDTQLVHEAKRAEGIIKKRPNAQLSVIREWDKLAALEGILARAKGEIDAAMGIPLTFQGQSEGEKSGVAVESLAELGAQVLGRVNANYQLSRKLVGELAFSYVVAGMGTTRRIVRIPKKTGQNKKDIVVNDGMRNRVSMLRSQVALQPVHTSAGFKHYQHQRIDQAMRELPEDVRMEMLPAWIETFEGIPNSDRLIEAISKKAGIYADEEQAAMAEQQQAEQAEQERKLEQEGIQAENEQKAAQAEKYRAEAEETRANTDKIRKDMLDMDAEVDRAASNKLSTRDRVSKLSGLLQGIGG